MGWRFRRSFRIAPGIRLNMGKTGFTSLSVGGRGATLNLGKRSVTGTVSVPVTGLSYQHQFKGSPPAPNSQPPLLAAPVSGRTIISLASVAVFAVGGCLALRSLPPSLPPSIPVTVATVPVVPTVVAPATAAVTSQNVVPQTVMARGPVVSVATRQVTTIQANVRAAPSMSGPVVRTFLKGQLLQVLQTENGWTLVAEQDREPVGWMHNSVLK